MSKNNRTESIDLEDNDNISMSQIKNESVLAIKQENLDGKFTGYLLFCLSVAVLGAAFQVGWNIGIYNTPIEVIKNFFNQVYIYRYGRPITTSEFDLLWSITNGLLPLGAAIGGFSSGFASDYFGRKNGLIYTNIFVIICGVYNIISKFINSFEILMIARFFSGIFCGLFTGILPLYLSELPPQNLRGLVGTMNQLILVLGILVTNVYGISDILGTDSRWPILVGLMLVPALAHIGLFFAVESPKYLYLKKNKIEEAREALIKLRGARNQQLVENELHFLENEKIEMNKQKEVTWGDLFTVKSLRRPLTVAVCVHIAQQFSGINAVIFYSTKIFDSVGLKGQWPTYATIILGVVQVIMTLVCMFIIERAGRKVLLLVGMIGMCIFSFGLGIFRIFGGPDKPVLNYFTVVSAVSYIIFFSIGPGAIPWLLTAEMFNSNARAKANSIAVLTNWFSAFIVTVVFPFLEAAIGNYSFIVFGGLLVLFSLFMFFFVPETKNKSADDLANEFNSSTLFLFGKGKNFYF